MASHPAEYRCSSCRANAQGEASALVSPHALYHALGKDAEERQVAYHELFRHELDSGVVDAIRQATNGNIVVGGLRFSGDIAKALGWRVTMGAPGRPKKVADPELGSLFEWREDGGGHGNLSVAGWRGNWGLSRSLFP